MPPVYPVGIKAFVPKVDGVDDVMAEHVNSLQEEVTAIETELGTLPKGGSADVKARFNAVDALLNPVAAIVNAINDDGIGGGVFIGSDTQLYRDLANRIRTPDNFRADGYIMGASDGPAGGVFIGSDCQIYRSVADLLHTEDNFEARTVKATDDTGFFIGADCQIYRFGANDIRTPDKFRTESDLYVGGGTTHIGNVTITNDGLAVWSKLPVGYDPSEPGIDIDSGDANKATHLKAGIQHPVYLIGFADVHIGMNAYYNSGWKFGSGSAAKYAGRISFDTTLARIRFGISNATGNADTVATIDNHMVIDRTAGVSLPITGMQIFGKLPSGTEPSTPGLDVDSGAAAASTNAKFGNSLPLYFIHNSPIIGFNMYYDGANMKYGKGSAGHYGGRWSFAPAAGDLTWRVSNTTGNADAAVGVENTIFTLKQDGRIQSTKAVAARVYRTTSQSINNVTWTAISFDAEQFDNDTIHEGVTNPTRLTCKTAGVYQITGHANFAPNATGTRHISIRIGGATFIALQSSPNLGVGNGINFSITTIWEMAVNDYAELCVYQDSGGALNIQGASRYSPDFGMHRVA